jgi:phosphodiesterase/alkaline phosphatase D-like protein
MPITRRQALGFAAAGTALPLFPTPAWATATARGLYPADGLVTLSVLQGPTDHNSATFIILPPAGLPIEIAVKDNRGRALPSRIIGRYEMPEAGFAAVELLASGLTVGQEYWLELAGGDGTLIDRRRFGALDVSARSCRFAVASCMADRFRRHAVTMWETMAREACDFVVLLGDTCYADVGNPGHQEIGYHRRYSETRNLLSWFRMERLVPTFAVWDDHDFGANNADRTFAKAAFTRELFRAFWGGTDNSAWRQTFGVGGRLEAFGQRFYLLDDRSYRDPPEVAAATHWGSAQREWLLADIGRSANPAWLMNGTQFFGDWLLRESVESDHPVDLQLLTNGVRQIAAPTVFVSGDTHFSEIERLDPSLLGYESREYTSSSIHSTPSPTVPSRLRKDTLAVTRRHNFLVFDADAGNGSGLSISCRALVEGGRAVFSESVAIGR